MTEFFNRLDTLLAQPFIVILMLAMLVFLLWYGDKHNKPPRI